MLKLKLHLRQRAYLLEKTLILGKIEVRRKRGQQRIGWVDGITDLMDVNLGKLWETMKDWEAWHVTVHGVTRNRQQLSY